MTSHQVLAINNYPTINDKINHNEKAVDKNKTGSWVQFSSERKKNKINKTDLWEVIINEINQVVVLCNVLDHFSIHSKNIIIFIMFCFWRILILFSIYF